MGEIVVAFRVVGYSCNCKKAKSKLKIVERELSNLRNCEDAEQFFKNLKGEVKFIKEESQNIDSEEKVLYSNNYLNAIKGYAFN